jgi:hypothetical protein
MFLKIRSPLLLGGISLVIGAVYGAESPVPEDAPLPDAKTLSEQIESFAATRSAQKKAFFRDARLKLAGTIRQSGGAGNYAMRAMMEERFEGKKGGNAEGAEWKRNNTKLLSDPNLDRAAKLHLNYLLLTLQRAEYDSAEPVQKEVWAYLGELYGSADVVANVDKSPMTVKFDVYDDKQGKVVGRMMGDLQQLAPRKMGDNPRQYVDQLLNGSVGGGWVAKMLGLDGHLPGLDSWEMTPGNFSGILESNVRPVLRKAKDPALLSTWDYEISFRALVISKDLDEKPKLDFEKKELPRLLWRKAKDAQEIGMPNRALAMEIDLAKKYPAHEDFEEWTKEILESVEKLKKAEAEKKAASEMASPGGTASPSGTPAI